MEGSWRRDVRENQISDFCPYEVARKRGAQLCHGKYFLWFFPFASQWKLHVEKILTVKNRSCSQRAEINHLQKSFMKVAAFLQNILAK